MKTKQIQDVSVPSLGFGTWQLTGDTCRRAVAHALDIGYRHLDTARMYENEVAVGQGMRDSAVSREEIFLTSKVWYDDLEPAAVEREIIASLQDLQVDYLDLALIHWPNPDIPLEQTLEALHRMSAHGLTRRIGVSNFTPDWLRRALQHQRIFCNQVEFHPLLRRDELLNMAVESNLLLTAYCPLAQGLIRNGGHLDDIAQKHGKSPEQIALRWLVEQPNTAAVPRSSNPDHIASNFDIFDFSLDGEDHEAIKALPNGQRQVDPEIAPAWEL